MLTAMGAHPEGLKKRVIISSVDAHTGLDCPIVLNDLENDEMRVRAVLGSAAVPFAFPPSNITLDDGAQILGMDGGTNGWNSNIQAGVDECFKLDGINSLSQIEVDALILYPT